MKLKEFFLDAKHRPINKWLHYFEIYERYFEKYRDKPITLIEIGVAGGGSLQMWKDYFPLGNIIGVDIDRSTQFSEPRIEVRIFNQEDRKKLASLPDADIVIDDGGHRYKQHLPTFEVLYPKTRSVYLIEDTHTAYWPRYGTGDNIISHAKANIDRLHAWHYSKVDDFVDETKAIHFHDSVIVYEKGQVEPPKSMVV